MTLVQVNIHDVEQKGTVVKRQWYQKRPGPKGSSRGPNEGMILTAVLKYSFRIIEHSKSI